VSVVWFVQGCLPLDLCGVVVRLCVRDVTLDGTAVTLCVRDLELNHRIVLDV